MRLAYVGGKAIERQAASTSQMGRFEHGAIGHRRLNVEAYASTVNGVWIRTHRFMTSEADPPTE